jgi:tetratricopeptide (TPR) repeat protein
MNRRNPFSKYLICAPLILLTGCVSNQGLNKTFSESRQSIALSLEQDNNLAASLIQWKILNTAYPNDRNINQQISRLEDLIKRRVKTLQSSLASAKSKGQKTQIRITNLKILALDPNNENAQNAMRDIEKALAFVSADSKTANIKKYFKENQSKANKSITTSKYLTEAKKLDASGQYNKLLKLSTDVIIKYPSFKPAVNYKYGSLINLAKKRISEKNIEVAVTLYEQALTMEKTDNKELVKKITVLKNELSQKYYRQGMEVFKNDIKGAIKLLETSLSYNPKNLKAARQLPRATRIQKKLEQINN